MGTTRKTFEKASSKSVEKATKRESASTVKVKREPSDSSLSSPSTAAIVSVNRAPVLTLWMSVCLRRLGHAEDTALTVAKVITGRCANAAGRALGIIRSPPPGDADVVKKPASRSSESAGSIVEIAGHKVPVSTSSSGSVLAMNGGAASSVDTYLKSAFKHDLEAVRRAMEK